MPGAGLYVGVAGAVAATGTGSYIWKHMFSVEAYEKMAAGHTPAPVLQMVLDGDVHRDGHLDIGLIAVGQRGYAPRVTREKLWAPCVCSNEAHRPGTAPFYISRYLARFFLML